MAVGRWRNIINAGPRHHLVLGEIIISIKKFGAINRVCVSSTKLKDYQAVPDRLTVLPDTKSNKTIKLKLVTSQKNTDYYLEVKSPEKALKEASMKNQFERRFEEELQKIHKAIHSKGGVKKLDKVHQRIGRARKKYPSAQQYCLIEVTSDEKIKYATEIRWKIDEAKYNGNRYIRLGRKLV